MKGYRRYCQLGAGQGLEKALAGVGKEESAGINDKVTDLAYII